jgi:hypothetical protein
MPEGRTSPAECANCGAIIPLRARACAECGCDERTGWREGSIYDGVDLPDEAWREDADAAQGRPGANRGFPWYWWCVSVTLLVAITVGAVTILR